MLSTDSLTCRWIAPDLARRVPPVLAAGWLGFGPGVGGAGPRLRRQVTGGRAGRWVMLTRDACCLAPAGGRCLRRA